MSKRRSVDKDKQNFVNAIGYFIFYLMVGFIPHIYKYMEFESSTSEQVYFKVPMYADVYMLGKSQVFLFLTVALLVVFAYQLSNKHYTFIRDKITIGTGVFALVVILSSLMSDYQDLVYWGAKDRFEGMWVWIAYLVVFTVARHYGRDKRFIKTTLKVASFSATVMACFGLLQVFGYDIYTVGALRWLAFPKEIAMNMSDYMVANTTEAGAVASLFNSNYFGVYVGVFTMVSLGFAFVEENGSKLFLAAAAIQYGALIASKSEAALLGFAVAMFLFVVYFGERIIAQKYYAMGFVIFAIAMDRYLAANLLYGQSGNALWVYMILIAGLVIGWLLHCLLNKSLVLKEAIRKHALILSVFSIALVTLVINLGIDITGNSGFNKGVKEVEIIQNIMVLQHYNESSIGVECTEEGINVYDQNMKGLKPEVIGENHLQYQNAGITYDLKIQSYINGIAIKINAPTSLNVFYDGELIQYVNPVSGLAEIAKPDRLNYYYDHGSAFTNRAYIWSTYLPEAQKYFALGRGLDTYLVAYPQNDYVGKTNFYLEGDTISVDKPHSMYIGILFSMGVGGLLIFLMFIVIVLKEAYVHVNLGQGTLEDFMPIICLIMILVTCIFNDSIIPVTMFLSCFGGMGLAIHEEA